MEKFKAVGITKQFGSRLLFQQPLNLSFQAGEVVALMGNNGTGKTTIIKLFCGLILPDTGKIFINGVNAFESRKKWMQDVGAFLEGPRSIYWRLSAFQNFLYFSGLKGIFGKDAVEQAEIKLSLFDLWDVKDNRVETFSLGMKQRLALACSMIHNPSIVLLDEPTTGLDSKSIKILENYIQKMSSNGTTIIFTSHDKEMVNRNSNKILMIRDGQIDIIL